MWDYERLQEIIKNPSAANLLNSSSILRKLLCDTNPLVHQANRNAKIKIQFQVSEYGITREDDPIFEGSRGGIQYLSQIDSLCPGNFDENTNIVQLNLDSFLSTKVVFIRGRMVSVLELIKYLSDNAGGVHKDKPSKESSKLLEGLGINHYVGGVPAPLRIILSVCQVVSVALFPLYKWIKA
ncbi:hypothetical protein [Sphingobium ummariense]